MPEDWQAVWSRASVPESATVEAECRAIYEAALEVARGWLVEVGTWRGRTAMVLAGAVAGRQGVRVATVDSFAPYDDGGQWTTPPSADEIRTLLGADVEVVAARSERAAEVWPADRKIALLFVDGAHDEDSVRADWAAWEPHLTADAVVLWHDYDAESGWQGRRFAGVRRTVDDLIDSGVLEYVRRVGTLLITTRRPTPYEEADTVMGDEDKPKLTILPRPIDERGRVTGEKPTPEDPPATRPRPPKRRIPKPKK